MVQVSVAGVALAGASAVEAQTQNPQAEAKKTMADATKILVAADPFAVTLKDAVVEHLKSKGYAVTDLGSTKDKPQSYFDCGAAVCKAMQAGQAQRAFLFCGTGMGMSIVANRFKGVTAAVVESVFAAKMSRAINNANVLCLGQMNWGEWMAKEAVDVFLNTKFTEGLDQFATFLGEACAKVEAIRP
jgi:ribose 5-phosphate isomerase B